MPANPTAPRPAVPRLLVRGLDAFVALEAAGMRLHRLPGSRRAALPRGPRVEAEAALRLAARALSREPGARPLPPWPADAAVSNTEAMLAVLEATDALERAALRYDTPEAAE